MPGKSASQFGTFRKRTIDEFLGMNLILTGLTFIDHDKEGKPLGDKSYYAVKATINETGEIIEFLSGQQYLKPFYQAVAAGNDYPVNFRITKPGKSYELSDWDENE